MIRTSLLVWALASLLPAHATTLGKASFDDLVQKSTAIVRGRVVSLLYRFARIPDRHVLQNSGARPLEGTGVHAGGGPCPRRDFQRPATELRRCASAYRGRLVRVLPVDRSERVTQLLGLSQGVLDVTTDDAGNIVLSSGITDALVVDGSGQTASPQALRMKLTDFSSRVSAVLKGAASAQ